MSFSTTVQESENVISFTKLDIKLEVLANLLHAYKVFGERDDDRYINMEKRGFKSMVSTHAATQSRNYLEISYRSSCVRLIINTKVINGEAFITQIDAYDHPFINETMDYSGLNQALNLVVNSN